MRNQQHAQPSLNRQPLSEATRRVNNCQQAPIRSSRSPLLTQNENPQCSEGFRPGKSSRYYVPTRAPDNSGNLEGPPIFNTVDPQPYTTSKDDGVQSKRNSQISTTSNRSDGKGIKAAIGPWKLGKTLGKGATARVRLARHVLTGQEAAIKIVQKKNAQMSQAGSLAAFDKAEANISAPDYGFRRMPIGIEREVAIMKLIQHPNIIKLFDIWENRTEIYLVLEYVDNGELFDHISTNGRLEEEEAIKYFRQMISAVGYCHSFNICHRDLKPENILLTKDLDIKIADFGMAALHQSPDHKLKTSCGSPHYAAPELIRGASYRGDKVDIWSMGVILYATLAGRLPFDVDSNIKDWMQVLLARIKKGSFEMIPHFSPEAADLIRKMLQVNPKDRITMPLIWNHPLLRKYDYLDNYGGGRVPNYPNVQECGSYVYRREDIDRDLLRNLRAMWHTLKEEDIINKLLSKHPNDQKVFFGLLLKHREAQLENYIPYLGYSSSDYHHARPSTMTKAYSTSQFPRPNTGGHGRHVSRFTVFSNVVGAETSYDSFVTSRREQLRYQEDRGFAKVNVVEKRENTRNNVRGSLSTTGASIADSVTRNRGHLRVPTSSRRLSTRSSLTNSVQSLGSSVHVRATVGHRRGVSFQNINRRSTNTETRTTGDAQQSKIQRSHSNDVDAINGARSNLRVVSAPVNYSAQTKPEPSQLWTEDMRQLSSSLAKICDKAFNKSSVISSISSTDNLLFTESPLSSFDHSLSLNDLSQKTPAQHVRTHQRTNHSVFDIRPLPPPPVCTESLRLELVKARQQAEIRRSAGTDGSPQYLDRMVTHIESLMQSERPISQGTTRYRNFSAPTEPGYARPKSELDPIQEVSPNKSAGQRAVSNPLPQTPVKERRYRGYGSNTTSAAQNTIRVVNPSPQLSPVKMPAPLTIRKIKSQVHSSYSGLNSDSAGIPYNGNETRESQQYKHDHLSNTVQPPTHIPQGHTSGDQITRDRSIPKFPNMFKRNSKGSIENKDQVSTGGQTVSGSLSTSVHTEEVVSSPVRKTKRFRFRKFFRRNRNRHKQANYRFEDTHTTTDQSTIRYHSSNSSEFIDPEAIRARQIEPRQSWIARLFNVKPACGYICMTLPKRQARREITQILRDWRQYGVRDIQVDKERNIVFGKVGAKNYLGMKEVSFAGEVMTIVEHGKRSHLSIAKFTQERGAASSFYKVVETLEMVLKCRGYLVMDEHKKEMMVQTLKAA
ncbi:hypothetical protein F5884DRAFT_843141 [Xylogone sp. PMI_703]|nr:hypothetical protein F5884DRAFT_843141 [Xylogone sp. PMI_703]